jgi:hypothetical protein
MVELYYYFSFNKSVKSAIKIAVFYTELTSCLSNHNEYCNHVKLLFIYFLEFSLNLIQNHFRSEQ